MNKIFTDTSILEQDFVSISDGDATTVGVSLIINTDRISKVDAVEVLLTYEELKVAIKTIEKGMS